jgi:F-type H+-transporting ATPase subunit b
MIGQMVSFVIFVWFCMKFVWPPLTQVLRERQKLIAAGLENASKAEQQLQQANEAVGNELEAAKREANDLLCSISGLINQIIGFALCCFKFITNGFIRLLQLLLSF